MRSAFVLAVFALAACSGNNAANNAAVAGESGDAEVTPLNDTTAIDAATGQAADMAADVNYTIDENEMDEAASSTSNKSSTEKPAKKKAEEKPAPSYEPDEPGTPTVANNTTD